MGVDHEHENARCIFLKQPIGVVNMSTEGLHQKMMNLKASVVLLVGGGKPLPLERPLCTPLVTNIAVARPIMKDSRSPSFGPSAKYGNTAQRSNSKDPGLTVTPWKINTIKLIYRYYFILLNHWYSFMIPKWMDSFQSIVEQQASQLTHLLDQKWAVQHRDGLKTPKNKWLAELYSMMPIAWHGHCSLSTWVG